MNLEDLPLVNDLLTVHSTTLSILLPLPKRRSFAHLGMGSVSTPTVVEKVCVSFFVCPDWYVNRKDLSDL